jgi:hypothetical protein
MDISDRLAADGDEEPFVRRRRERGKSGSTGNGRRKQVSVWGDGRMAGSDQRLFSPASAGEKNGKNQGREKKKIGEASHSLVLLGTIIVKHPSGLKNIYILYVQ